MPVTLVSPGNGATNVPTNPELQWQQDNFTNAFQLQISLDADHLDTVFDQNIEGTTHQPTLNHGVEYFWRVRVLIRPGNNGIITFTDITTSSFSMNWNEATDSQYTHAQLTYHVYSSEISNLDTIAKAEANGTLETSQQGITSFEITGLQELETQFVNIVVENPDGFKGLFVMNEMTTEESEEVTQTVTIDSISEDSDGVHIGYTEIPEVDPITGQYEVLVTELDINDQTVSETVVVVGQDNPAQLTTLLEITKYNLRMRGANGPDKGPWGAVRSYTTMGTGAFSDPVAQWEVV